LEKKAIDWRDGLLRGDPTRDLVSGWKMPQNQNLASLRLFHQSLIPNVTPNAESVGETVEPFNLTAPVRQYDDRMPKFLIEFGEAYTIFA
jgi:hypothetical protein